MWNFAEIRASKHYDQVVDDLGKFPGARWFPGAQLNFAENLLRHRDDQLAFLFLGENRISKRMTYAELYDEVARFAHSLKETGVERRRPGRRLYAKPGRDGDCDAGGDQSRCHVGLLRHRYWPGAAIERLGQVEPKLMITADGYFYKGKDF